MKTTHTPKMKTKQETMAAVEAIKTRGAWDTAVNYTTEDTQEIPASKMMAAAPALVEALQRIIAMVGPGAPNNQLNASAYYTAKVALRKAGVKCF